jgi:hypothetical protein
VNAKQAFTLMERFAERLNVKQTTTAVMTNVARTICARLFVLWEHLVVIMLCAQLQTTNKSVNVNLVSQEILKSFVSCLTSVKVHHVDQELPARTTEAPSDALVPKDL